MVNTEIISIGIFLAIIALLVYRDRKKIEFKSVLMIRRTRKGKEWVYSFGKKHEKFLRTIGTIGVMVAIIASTYGSYLLLNSTYNLILKRGEVVQPLKLVLPTVSGVNLPGFILGVPFWYWIIGVFLVMLSHEGMHALLARAEKIKIKSFGVLLLLFLPGAFVEPDEKQLARSTTMKKLRIYSAGSFGNFILAAVILVLLFGYNFGLNRIIISEGITFEKTIPNTGAENAGLKGIITQVNSQNVKNLDDFIKIMETIKPGEMVKIKTTEGLFTVKTSINPDDSSKPYIGIQNIKNFYVYNENFIKRGVVTEKALSIVTWFSGLLGWSFMLNIGVGVFNLFPLKPLDGGLIFEEVIKFFYKGKWLDKIVNFVSLTILVLVVLNLFGPQLFRLVI